VKNKPQSEGVRMVFWETGVTRTLADISELKSFENSEKNEASRVGTKKGGGKGAPTQHQRIAVSQKVGLKNPMSFRRSSLSRRRKTHHRNKS